MKTIQNCANFHLQIYLTYRRNSATTGVSTSFFPSELPGGN